ncbi:MAG: cysteine desulfurase family protein, partial [Nitratireductor sp.]
SKLYVSATEHPCVLAGGRFEKQNIATLPVLESGLLDLNALEETLKNHDKTSGAAMVSVMLANNETGILQPMEQISKLVLEHDAFLCVDAVQAFGKIPLDIANLGAHFIILSSHKIGGPQGAGALIFGNASISANVLIAGGGQENFQRAGTENIAAIAGFGAACEQIVQKIAKKDVVGTIRDSIEEGIRTICHAGGNKIGKPVFFSSQEHGIDSQNRLPNTTCFAIPGIKAETALISLDLAGFAVSSGSACSSGKVKKSHVLHAMGVSDEVANCALRISTGYETSPKDAENFLGEMKNIVNRMG